ncbi:MAG: hypothetical protein HUU20_18080, partial [Pirellulales bacterium]|nr:hypothetical protein [Pirellulales bacterium]
MNSLKNLFIIAVLAAVAYGVYVSLNKENQSTPPSGVADGWGGPINVQLPTSATAAPAGAPAAVGTGLTESPGIAAGQPAPPFAATGLASPPTPPLG